MIKKFSKKQGSKQGVILLTVVFILAMAVIFISACMVMTQATRNRLYWKAEQSQARLTVTSAAEAFYQALIVGDFQENQLKTLAKASASGIYMTAKDADENYLPGMSLDPQNCTLLSLKAKDSVCSEIYAYLVTTIDGQSEKVKITFKVKETPKVYGLFGNPVDYNGTIGQLNFEQLGYVIGGGSKSDNFLVVRKGSVDADSSSSIYSSIIFVDGDVTAIRATMQPGADLVFLDGAKWAVGKGGNDAFGNNKAGPAQAYGVFFIGAEGNSDALVGDSDYGMFKTSSPVVFYNRNINDVLTDAGSKPIYAIDLSDTEATWNSDLFTNSQKDSSQHTPSDPGAEALATVFDKSTYYSSDTFNKQIGTFPTTEQACAKLKLNGEPLPQEAPDTFEEMDLSTFISKYGNTGADGTKVVGNEDEDPATIEKNNIKITSGGTIGTGTQSGTRYTFLFDGNTDYVIYLTDDISLTKCTFAVLNPNENHNQLIVLQSGVDLTISSTDAQGKDYNGAGFLSVPRKNPADNATVSDTVANYLSYIYTVDIPGGGEMSATNSVSPNYDSETKPTFYVIGVGNNQVFFGADSYFEGYMGLFNPESSSSTSCVSCCEHGGNQYIYGRMMFDGWNSGNDAGRLYMPYCPGPGEESDKPDIELYQFGYTVVSVDYYYTE